MRVDHDLVERIKKMYPEGTRLVLISMDDPRPIEPGTRGTVDFVDDIGTIHCKFDNGRCLGLIVGEDSFRKLTVDELREELIKTQKIIED